MTSIIVKILNIYTIIKMKITLIRTGGTIAAEPYGETSPAVATMNGNGEIVAEKLANYFPDATILDVPLFNKDSQLLTDDDRRVMLEAIQQHQESSDLIILTHGTDTMRETAHYFADRLHADKARVVLTGSMLPLSNGDHSDGYSNFAFLQESWDRLPPLSVVMHGTSFGARDFVKVKQEEPFYFFALRSNPMLARERG
jgi:L-asparaginase